MTQNQHFLDFLHYYDLYIFDFVYGIYLMEYFVNFLFCHPDPCDQLLCPFRGSCCVKIYISCIFSPNYDWKPFWSHFGHFWPKIAISVKVWPTIDWKHCYMLFFVWNMFSRVLFCHFNLSWCPIYLMEYFVNFLFCHSARHDQVLASFRGSCFGKMIQNGSSLYLMIFCPFLCLIIFERP